MGPFWLLLLVLPSHHGTSAAPGVYTAGITPTSETYLDPCWDPYFSRIRPTYHPAVLPNVRCFPYRPNFNPGRWPAQHWMSKHHL